MLRYGPGKTGTKGRRDPDPAGSPGAEIRSRPDVFQRYAAADQHCLYHRSFRPVLFLDEPTTGLDVFSRRLVIDTIQHMNREGSSVLITTHNIEEANALCSTISVIHKGKIIATGKPEKLKKHYDTLSFIEISFEPQVARGLFTGEGIKQVEPRGDKWRIYVDNADLAVKTL
jgi:ABC-2 type transport system ATP-binding protein